MLGGKLEEYPDWETKLRSVLFPEYKRVVKVRITSYRGISFGAIHFYVKFDVEENPILIPIEDGYKEIIPHDMPREHRQYDTEGIDLIYDKFLDHEDEYESDEEADQVWEDYKNKFCDYEYAKKFARVMSKRLFPAHTWDVRLEKEIR